MGFVWRSSGVGTITEHEQTEELVHNIDHVWHLLSEPVSAKIWSEMPSSAGEYLEVIDMEEVRAMMDYLADNNHCDTHYVSHFVSQFTSDQKTDNTINLSGDLSSNLLSVEVGQNTGEHTSNLSGRLSGYNSGENSAVQTGQHYRENTGVYGSAYGEERSPN